MSKNPTGSRLYGFEDYKIVKIGFPFTYTWSWSVPYSTEKYSIKYVADNNLPIKQDPNANSHYAPFSFEPALYEDNKELLATAKKLYVHPSCKISRSLMAEKYSKSLNPWMADAVVVPEPSYNNLWINRNSLLFINENAKLIVVSLADCEDAIKLAESFELGSTFRSLCRMETSDRATVDYKSEDLLNAELFYKGLLLEVPNNQQHILDILTRSLPVSKTVFEDTVQESLSTEDNQVTLESLVNIIEMLNSTDRNTNNAALKALSMLDYMHYSNSIKYVIREQAGSNYKYIQAANSTPVKFMFHKLSQRTNRNCWPGGYSSNIYECDYQLFLQLLKHYEHYTDETIHNALRYYPFMRIGSDGILVPNIKQQE